MAVDNSRPARVRVAPSPTGDPHVGTAYMALFNYVFARKTGGQFVLRIDDTDRSRRRADSEAQITEALHWLGLDWDEGPDKGGPHAPYRQSERQQLYIDHSRRLIERGGAYRCFCSPERLDELRARQREEKARFGYDRRCRGIEAAESSRRAEAGEPFTVRLAMPIEGVTRFRDHLRGEIEFANEQIDDQVLIKSDGFPTYHLATVVDDHLMEITHIVRAEEWISSTPKHAVLYDNFGWERPIWIHMPLLRNPDGSKISKRTNPVSINYYEDAGILPAAMLNFLGILGWSIGGDREKFTLQEMIEAFDWSRISLGGPIFDPQKLRWLNEKYIHELSYEQLADWLFGWRFSRDHILRILPLVRERIKRLDDFIGVTEFFFSGDLDYTPMLGKLEKAMKKVGDVKRKDLRKGLLELVECYEALPEWKAEPLESASRQFCDDRKLHTRHYFMLLRILVTGRDASPPLFDTMEVLGKELTRRRLRQGAELIKSMK